MSNSWVILGCASMLLAQIIFTYAPFMNSVFHSAPVALDSWARILAVALGGYLLIKVEKGLRRILPGKHSVPPRRV